MKTMQAVVLAAGRGTRLGRLTIQRSKAMLPVAGEPLVGRVLERLRVTGLQRFVIVGGPDDEELVQYCRDQQSGSLSHVVQTERRGMAHALACAAPLIDSSFVLAACDNLVASDFVAEMIACLENTGADGVLALQRMSPERCLIISAVPGRSRCTWPEVHMAFPLASLKMVNGKLGLSVPMPTLPSK